MKIRNGFVSNSSSSSFVIRGVRIKDEELQKLWNVTGNSYLGECAERKLDVEEDRDYFNDKKAEYMIVGISQNELEDGCVIELQDTDDDAIKKQLEENGIKVEKLSTFIQYISNDNY